jgi:acetyl-CoA decarbonylase/synthase complex subunit delta
VFVETGGTEDFRAPVFLVVCFLISEFIGFQMTLSLDKEGTTLAFEFPKQPYSGKIGTTTIGTGKGALILGGEESYPFYLFEGKMPNPPKIAMEVWDYDPSNDWPAAAVEPFRDVISSPEGWARKCVKDYGADLIILQMKSIDPNGMDRKPDEAAAVAKKVIDAVDVPVVVWGTANNQKDEEVLKKISEICQSKSVSLSPVEEGNHKGVGASALAYGHVIVASSPIDVNLAKQLNILLGNLGVATNRIIIDPTTGGLGYGLEYSYSVMERIRMAALTQEDDKLQIPMISNVGNEIWKCKEAGQSIEDAPTLGDPEKRGIMMESVAATCYLMAGSDVVILRHPESVRLVRAFIDRMVKGGAATDVKPVVKKLPLKEADLISIAPPPQTAVGKEEASAKAAKAATAPKKEEKPKTPPAKPAEKVVEIKPKAEEAKPKAEPDAKAEAKAKAEAEARAKAEAEARAKKEAEDKAEAEAQAKAKAEADVKAQAEAEARKKVEATAKEKDELQALREKRAQQKAAAQDKDELRALAENKAREEEAAASERKARDEEKAAKRLAKEPETMVDRLAKQLDRIHRRA